MCRAVAYIGPPTALSSLLHAPDSALVRQSIDPRYLHMLNLAGFGMASWNTEDDDPNEPLLYRSTEVPIFDANLVSLASKLQTTCMLGHVRGVAYRANVGVGPQNQHPFRYTGSPLALCHNGDLSGFGSMKPALQEHIKPSIRAQVMGTTDSEWVYALLLSHLEDPGAHPTETQLLRALDATLRTLRTLREAHGIDRSSSLNLFISDGRQLLALRFTFDFGRYSLDPTKMHEANSHFLSLWATMGSEFSPDADGRWAMRGGSSTQATILASEPLTRDPTGWMEVGEYTAVTVTRAGDELLLRTNEMDA